MSGRNSLKRLRQIGILESFALADKTRRMDTGPSPDSGILLDSSTESTSMLAINTVKDKQQQQPSSSRYSTLATGRTVVADRQQQLSSSNNNSERLMAVTLNDSDREPPVSLSPNEPSQASAEGPPDTLNDSDETQIDFTPPLFDSEPQSDDDSQANDPVSLGTPLTEMRTIPQCSLPLPTLKSSSDHAVLFKDNFGDPWSDRCRDVWDEHHVRMPCSPQNLYPVLNERTGEKQLEERWALIVKALNRDINSSRDLEAAILSYNTRYKQRWNFYSLHRLFDELDETVSAQFFQTTLPRMIRLAMRLPELVTVAIPLLKQGRTQTVTMSQMQAASLLANAFFCTFPRRNSTGKHSEYKDYPHINFANLFNGRRYYAAASNINSRRCSNDNKNERQIEKLKCLLHYFRRVTTNEPCGSLSFKRQHLTDYPNWQDSKRQFPRLHVTSNGTIEDEGIGMLQVDFANMFVGGGVLSRGCVQEEIRFVICPELIVSMLLSERMTNTECVIITGCERFSSQIGYADSFEWNADYVDTTPRDAWGRKCVQVVAIDAKPFRYPKLQYAPEWLKREINKAYCGFSCPRVRSENLAAIATGNWGCGVYQGDPRFKALLQMMAAAEAGRDVVYFTFQNAELCRDINAMHRFICQEKRATVGLVFNTLEKYHSMVKSSKDAAPSKLYDFLRENMSLYDSDTDIEDASTVN